MIFFTFESSEWQVLEKKHEAPIWPLIEKVSLNVMVK